MAHGGARDGAGRPAKYYDLQGNPLPTKRVSVPTLVTQKDLNALVLALLKARDKLSQ